MMFQVLTRDITEGFHPPHWSKHCAPMVLPTRRWSPVYTSQRQCLELQVEADSKTRLAWTYIDASSDNATKQQPVPIQAKINE